MVLHRIGREAVILQCFAVIFQYSGRHFVCGQIKLAEVREQACSNMLVAFVGGRRNF